LLANCQLPIGKSGAEKFNVGFQLEFVCLKEICHLKL
jgi:hypothetical protein